MALYGIGGVGYYSSKEPAFDLSSQSNFGWNVGGGFRFPLTGFSAYVEARYHRISNADISMVPVSFGLIF
jgi:opacity protein-like surface antigen